LSRSRVVFRHQDMLGRDDELNDQDSQAESHSRAGPDRRQGTGQVLLQVHATKQPGTTAAWWRSCRVSLATTGFPLGAEQVDQGNWLVTMGAQTPVADAGRRCVALVTPLLAEVSSFTGAAAVDRRGPSPTRWRDRFGGPGIGLVGAGPRDLTAARRAETLSANALK